MHAAVSMSVSTEYPTGPMIFLHGADRIGVDLVARAVTATFADDIQVLTPVDHVMLGDDRNAMLDLVTEARA